MVGGYGRADITRTAGSARTTRGKRRSGRVQGPGARSAVSGGDGRGPVTRPCDVGSPHRGMADLPAADRRRQAGPRDGDRGRGPHADRGPGRIVPVPGAHAADQLVQHPAALHGEASERCRDDVSVWRCALVPAATTEKERVPGNAMLWFFFATGAAIWIALWAAIRVERRLGLTPAPTRNAPVARPAGRHHRCRNMPPARRPGLCHGLTSPARPSALALPAIRNPAEAPPTKPAVLAPPPGPAAPSR
jgi:hypothetical protein